MISIHWQKAIVTGAGKGLGKELVKAFLMENVSVLAISRSEEDLLELEEECEYLQKDHETTLHTMAGDVSLESGVDQASEIAREQFD